MRIIIFSQIVRKVSGLFTFEANFIKTFHKDHEISYVYKAGYEPRLKELEPFCRTVQDVGQLFECDICIFSSLQHGEPHPSIKARRYIQVIHTDLKDWNVDYNRPEFITDYVAVGDGVANTLKTHFGIDSHTIPNILPSRPTKRAIRLITASRIAEGKGFERMVEMAKRMQLAGIPFIWEIYGDGTKSYIEQIRYEFSGVQGIFWGGFKADVMPFIQTSDFLVQLSDSEGSCYSMFEALQCGTPVIVTKFDQANKYILDGYNGFLIDFDMKNFDPQRLVDYKKMIITPPSNSAEDLWKQLFKI